MSRIRIENGRIFTEKDGFVNRMLLIVGERIASEADYEACPDPEEIIDAQRAYVIPGLTDIHFHGCVGYDCCDASREALDAMGRYELSCGITSVTPATMTIPQERLEKICLAAAERADMAPPADQADFCGLYMEGPFISPARKGAQKAEDIRLPDIELFRKLQAMSGGLIRTLVAAPEMEGAQALIRTLAEHDEVRVSLGHTDADYDTAMAAFQNGARGLTHLYNAMPPLVHRAPGPIGAAADRPDVMAELICDGIHVHPSAVRAAFRLFGEERIIMISDSMRATGMPDGRSELGGQTVFKTGRRAVLADGTLAGSVTNLMDCLRTAVKEMDIPLTAAVRAAAVNPAKAVGIYGDYGRLEPGSLANAAVLGEDLTLRMVLHRGKTVDL